MAKIRKKARKKKNKNKKNKNLIYTRLEIE